MQEETMGSWRTPAQPAADIVGLAHRLTDRDRAIVYDVGRFRTLTLRQIARLHFSSHSSARDRVKSLVELEVLRRFRTSTRGEYCHVLALPGLRLFLPMLERAREQDIVLHKMEEARPSKIRATRIGAEALVADLLGNPLLKHLVASNDFYTRLVAARDRLSWKLERWFTEREVWWATGNSNRIRPDGAAKFVVEDRKLLACFEHDTGTETLGRLIDKLDRYKDEGAYLLLLELTKLGREANFHQFVAAVPNMVVATSTVERAVDPTDAVWWRVGDPPGTLRGLEDLIRLPRSAW
jgi:hypothetical protein